jgi:hypothetical protein
MLELPGQRSLRCWFAHERERRTAIRSASERCRCGDEPAVSFGRAAPRVLDLSDSASGNDDANFDDGGGDLKLARLFVALMVHERELEAIVVAPMIP